MAGRKTKLTPELQEKIIKRLRAGFYAKEACKAVGIGESTFYDWLKWGKEGREPFSEFSELTQQAEAEGELNIFLEIRQQVKKDWRAGMEILGRKYPKRWGRKEMHGGIKDSPIEIEIKNKDLEDELIKKLDIIRERVNANKGKKQRK